MKHMVLALRLDPGKVTLGGEPVQIKLPDGCIGIMFVFESKKKAREWWGNDTELLRIEKREPSTKN